MLDLADQDFKAIIKNIFKKLKVTMIKGFKEDSMIVS